MGDYEVKAGLVEVDAFNICGVTAVVDNIDGNASEKINALWSEFFERETGRILENDKDGDIIFAVYSDYEGDHTKPYRLTIGYRILGDAALPEEKAKELYTVKIETGAYAVLSAAGEQPKALISTWESVWSSDLDRSYKSDFEVYGPRFFEEGVHEVLIHIGLKV